MEFSHVPVMLNECLDGLKIKSDGIYVDGTVGGAGHSIEIVKKLGEGGRLIAVDRDSDALEERNKKRAPHKDKGSVVHDGYKNLASELDSR